MQETTWILVQFIMCNFSSTLMLNSVRQMMNIDPTFQIAECKILNRSPTEWTAWLL